jgi:putative sterol carrier protein
MLGLRSSFDPEAGADLDATYELRFGEDRLTVRIREGRITITRGEAPEPDAILETDPRTFAALLTGREFLGPAIESGAIQLVGDARLAQRLVDAVQPHPGR